jgi:hypothetical protein
MQELFAENACKHWSFKNQLAGIQREKEGIPGIPDEFPQIPAKFPHLTKAKSQSYQCF